MAAPSSSAVASIAEDRARIAEQERRLVFPRCDYDTAWSLGTRLRALGHARNLPIVIDIRRFGDPHQQLFYTAFPGTTPDNARWVLRKARVVAPLPSQLLRRRPLSRRTRRHLRREALPPRRRLCHPRRRLPHLRRERRHHRLRHRLRPPPAPGPRARRRSPLPRAQPRLRHPQTPLKRRSLSRNRRFPLAALFQLQC